MGLSTSCVWAHLFDFSTAKNWLYDPLIVGPLFELLTVQKESQKVADRGHYRLPNLATFNYYNETPKTNIIIKGPLDIKKWP